MGEIAKYAGVERAAVSNWRRRHKDFPLPVVDDARRPLFDSDQIAQWLDRRWLPQKEQEPGDPVTYGERFREGLRLRSITALRQAMPGDELIIRGLALAAASSLLERVPGRGAYQQIRCIRPDLSDLFKPYLAEADAESSPLGRVLADMLGEMRPADVAERLIEQADRVDAAFRSTVTPGPICDLIVKLCASHSWHTVYDPAAGIGSLLLKAVSPRSHRHMRVTAADSDGHALRTLQLRFLSHGLDVDLLQGNAFNGRSEIKADLVVADPPFVPVEHADQPYGPFDWVRLAHRHLTTGGMACIVVPAWSLQRTGLQERSARTRAEMAQAGLIRAVIQLPPRSNSFRVGAALALVVLDQAEGSNRTIVLAEAERLGRHWAERIAAFLDERPEEIPDGFGLVDAEGCDDRVSLLPSATRTQNIERTADALLDAQRMLARCFPDDEPLLHTPLLSALDKRQAGKLGDYVRSGRLTVLAGYRIPAELVREGGITVVGREELRSEIPIGQRGLDVLDLGKFKAVRQTQPGDVIALSVDPVRAFVDAEGGKVVMAPAQVLRIVRDPGRPARQDGIAPQDPDWMTPHILAALLNATGDSSRTNGGLVRRVNLREVEVPTLEPHEVASLDRVLRSVAERGADLRRKLTALEEFEAALVAGIVDGVIRPAGKLDYDR
ncbi:N-6 DNA methylase [Sphaerimonospora thailandensis]|nr:N-6 DNA methylase [Sphaerimonospora thailandensis]